MTKQEQIKEMAITFCEHNGKDIFGDCDRCVANRTCTKLSSARILYKKGYRKEKETAREILRELYRFLSNFVDEDIGYQDECIETACLYEGLKDIAEKYGVEVEE